MSIHSYIDPSKPHSELTSSIIRCALTVHRVFGYGFLESVYRKATAVELRFHGIPVLQEVNFQLEHRGCDVGLYRSDLVVDQKVIVEIKTGRQPDPIGPELTLNYLKASGLTVGLFLNFGPTLSIKRVVYSHKDNALPEIEQL